MKILLVHNTRIPVKTYGVAERIIWWLGKALVNKGHDVSYLVKKGSECPFAKVHLWDEKKPIYLQIPKDIDLVHFHCPPNEPIKQPYLITIHENATAPQTFDRNSVFVSHNHAHRHGGSVFVHHGLDFEDYGEPFLDNKRIYFHFLGNAALRAKNINGAIDIASRAGERLHVIGGTRVNFRLGLRITLTPNVRFHGMLGGDGKHAVMNNSKGLIYPVLWHEPFGFAMIESLYFGCPVFGTPYGSLPELLGKDSNTNGRKPGNGQIDAYYSDLGCLSLKRSELAESVKNADSYGRKRCHEYVKNHFSAEQMAENYIKLYEKVLNGHILHENAPTYSETNGDKILPMGE